MKTMRAYYFPLLRWVATGLVTGLFPLSAVATSDLQKFPATGQTTCYDSARNAVACAGTGQDGDKQAGAALSYRDNGDGTVTDLNTKLVWEKKSDDDSIHDIDNAYTWGDALAVHIAGLNRADCVPAAASRKCGFAGKRDWRLPNVKELQSIVNYQNFNPAISAEFNTNCRPGATVRAGSCTAPSFYWSSTSFTLFPSLVWEVNFLGGLVVDVVGKSDTARVRAVRGGL